MDLSGTICPEDPMNAAKLLSIPYTVLLTGVFFFTTMWAKAEMCDGLESLRQPDGLEVHPMLKSTELTRIFRLNSGAHVFCPLKQVLRES